MTRSETPAVTVSVVTVCLDAEAHIEGAIASLRAQTYPHIEHVVVDGGSTDRTPAILERYRDGIARLVSEPDEGLYDAMNKGVRLATGDLVYFLNADDRFCDERVVADVAEVFAREPGLDLVYGDALIDRPAGPTRSVQAAALTRKALARSTVCHQAIFARRALFDRVGGFSTEYKVVSDFDWLVRAVVTFGARSRHVARDIALIGTLGRTYNTDWAAEKKRALRTYFSPAEILRWRTLPRDVWPRLRGATVGRVSRLVRLLRPDARVERKRG